MKPITEEDLRTKHIAEIYDMMERRYETCVLLSARMRWWSVAIRTHRFRLHRVSLVKHEEAKADMLQRWKGHMVFCSACCRNPIFRILKTVH